MQQNAIEVCIDVCNVSLVLTYSMYIPLCALDLQAVSGGYKNIFGKNSRFCTFSEVCANFNFLSEPLHNQQSSASKFEVSITQLLPKLAVAKKITVKTEIFLPTEFYFHEK